MPGAVERVRPKMMTVVAIMAGLLPILWSHGTGSEVMQRIAVPMIGGMVSSTVLTLVVIPAIYAVVKGFSCVARARRQRRCQRSSRLALLAFEPGLRAGGDIFQQHQQRCLRSATSSMAKNVLNRRKPSCAIGSTVPASLRFGQPRLRVLVTCG